MKTILLTALSLLIAAKSNAAIQSYPDRASWTAAVVAPTGGENFNGFDVDVDTRTAAVPIEGGTVRGIVAISAQIDVAPYEFPTGSYLVNGSAFLLGNINSSGSVNFEFTNPITAWSADVRRPPFARDSPNGRVVRIDVYGVNNSVLGTISLNETYPANSLEFYGFTL